MNSRSKNQSKRSAKPLTPNPSPLKRGEGSTHKDVGYDEAIAIGVASKSKAIATAHALRSSERATQSTGRFQTAARLNSNVIGGHRLRFAFTLMELMIALGLLGALMAVAWSLMGTFGSAEIRGWKLANRVQTIRSARDWLESDMQHLALSGSPTNLSMPALSEGPRFTGDSLGFTATIAPSDDPIPFLGNLMSDTIGPERKKAASTRSARTQSSTTQLTKLDMDYSATRDDATSSTIWPAETIEIEYRLSPEATQSVRPLAALAGNTFDTQFVLTRREIANTNTLMTVDVPSERVLSAQNLYRQSDDVSISSSSAFRESRLEGLTKVQFQYFDGSSWRPEWDSVRQGGLPIAIAFGFDFPAVSDMQPPSVPASNEANKKVLGSITA